MNSVKKFDYKLKTLVIGLGISGYASVEFLASKNCSFDVCDTRENPPNAEKLQSEFPQHQLIGGELSSDLLNEYEQLLVSPGISIRQQMFVDFQQQGKLLLGDVALFAQELEERRAAGKSQAKVIAITGSNGKSTVTTMVEHLANHAGIKALAGGNLGLPVLTMLVHEVDLYVLELSSFQLETVDNLLSESAVVLNISEDHMDRYDDISDYQRVKEKIYQQSKLQVLNLDESFAKKWQKKLSSKLSKRKESVGFSLAEPENGNYGLVNQDGKDYLAVKEEQQVRQIMPVASLKVKGQHNYANALAALALLKPWHLESELLTAALMSYSGLAHRCQWIRKLNGIDFYNDSKGTNVGASIAAINGFSEEIILIAGGEGKGADFSDLAKIVKQKVKVLVLFGRDAGLINQAIAVTGQEHELENKLVVKQVDSLTEAVSNAYELASPGMCVLFSPACASFDQYENYVSRGEDFVKQVKALI